MITSHSVLFIISILLYLPYVHPQIPSIPFDQTFSNGLCNEVSNYRERNGLNRLTYSNILTFVAATHVVNMVKFYDRSDPNGCSRHSWYTDPDIQTKDRWFSTCCYTLTTGAACMANKPRELSIWLFPDEPSKQYSSQAFENFQLNFNADANGLVYQWSISPGHDALLRLTSAKACGAAKLSYYYMLWIGNAVDSSVVEPPTNVPTNIPTVYPTVYPTKAPTNIPSLSPTNVPTFHPSLSPTNIPTKVPTHIPTVYPTFSPIKVPTFPTNIPTNIPTFPTNFPTVYPTRIPTYIPTVYPTEYPTYQSTNITSTEIPTVEPVVEKQTYYITVIVGVSVVVCLTICSIGIWLYCYSGVSILRKFNKLKVERSRSMGTPKFKQYAKAILLDSTFIDIDENIEELHPIENEGRTSFDDEISREVRIRELKTENIRRSKLRSQK
jgi:hypothetical protein